MSVQAMSYVIDNSRQKGVGYTLMLMIANHADRYGRNAFPSIPTLAAECRASERMIKRLLPAVEQAGELRIHRGIGPGGAHVFEVVMEDRGGDMVSPPGGDVVSPGGMTPVHPGGVKSGAEEGVTWCHPNRLNKEPSVRNVGGSVPSAERTSPGPAPATAPESWEEDEWLRDFLVNQKLVQIPTDYFLNREWWERVSIIVNGLGQTILERTFAALGNHFVKNPQARPVTKKGWLQKVENFLRKEREIMTRDQLRLDYGNQARR